jgi:hypothetical protein
MKISLTFVIVQQDYSTLPVALRAIDTSAAEFLK